jgi:hypothetical protein
LHLLYLGEWARSAQRAILWIIHLHHLLMILSGTQHNADFCARSLPLRWSPLIQSTMSRSRSKTKRGMWWSYRGLFRHYWQCESQDSRQGGYPTR